MRSKKRRKAKQRYLRMSEQPGFVHDLRITTDFKNAQAMVTRLVLVDCHQVQYTICEMPNLHLSDINLRYEACDKIIEWASVLACQAEGMKKDLELEQWTGIQKR